MKNTLLFLVCMSMQFIYSQGNNVVVENSYSDYIKIVDVYESSSATVVKLEFNPIQDITGTLHSPSGKSPYVITDKKGNRYALKSQSGWNGSLTGGFGSKSLKANKKVTVSLYFNKLKNFTDIYSLTEVDCEGTNCWNFYDIKVKAEATATLDKTWVDYDVTDADGSFGFKVHTKFYINHMKDQPFYLKYRLMKGDEFLKTPDANYRNISGQIELKSRLKTPYVKAVYNDKSMFLPYKLLREQLPEGVNKIKVDIDLFNEDGTLLKHLGFKEITYTKR
ncbi:MAG: hypothetical protein HKP48_00360 [Winogradskyella sp.]|uniref:hypothetical protein n=1 Tax=Winogradskyella sp. TaxID=1883156 RepID=UPI0017FC67C7|nr:hypothetical protein [Winogradskyella sp.]MBT8245956.1 hypothetical protein [Winogradskyella sp.]NNK21768.1 hypothetical protein [Winogradskyella sp.]